MVAIVGCSKRPTCWNLGEIGRLLVYSYTLRECVSHNKPTSARWLTSALREMSPWLDSLHPESARAGSTERDRSAQPCLP